MFFIAVYKTTAYEKINLLTPCFIECVVLDKKVFSQLSSQNNSSSVFPSTRQMARQRLIVGL